MEKRRERREGGESMSEIEREQNKIKTHWENQKMVTSISQEALRSIIILWEFKTLPLKT